VARLRRMLLGAVITVAVAFLGIQAIPYGRDHTNPPVRTEPRWDSAETRALTVRACHTNETKWPWYTSVAPISWLAQRDVVEGRRVLNFSEWDRPQREAHESSKSVRQGEMPPWFYVLPRTEAGLSAAERDALIRALRQRSEGSSPSTSEAQGTET
jgi:hypothetical protein